MKTQLRDVLDQEYNIILREVEHKSRVLSEVSRKEILNKLKGKAYEGLDLE